MAIVVSFLVVTRVNLALAQYREARGNLSTMLTATRDLVSATVGALCTKKFIGCINTDMPYRSPPNRPFTPKMTKLNLQRSGAT